MSPITPTSKTNIVKKLKRFPCQFACTNCHSTVKQSTLQYKLTKYFFKYSYFTSKIELTSKFYWKWSYDMFTESSMTVLFIGYLSNSILVINSFKTSVSALKYAATYLSRPSRVEFWLSIVQIKEK